LLRPQRLQFDRKKLIAAPRVVLESPASYFRGSSTAMPPFLRLLKPLLLTVAVLPGPANSSVQDDVRAVTLLNERYQKAVLDNDAATMDAILADDFVLYSSSGAEYSKKDLLAEARRKDLTYQRNECRNVRVRVWGDTAVVTASLWEAGVDKGKRFDNRVDFADVYVRTPTGWRYVVAHAWPSTRP
jgi:ketosteroid isomerase-like protein